MRVRSLGLFCFVHASSKTYERRFHGHVMGNSGLMRTFSCSELDRAYLQQEGIGGSIDRRESFCLRLYPDATSTSVLANGAAQAFQFDLRQKGRLAYVRGPESCCSRFRTVSSKWKWHRQSRRHRPAEDYLVAYEHLSMRSLLDHLFTIRDNSRYGNSSGNNRCSTSIVIGSTFLGMVQSQKIFPVGGWGS